MIKKSIKSILRPIKWFIFRTFSPVVTRLSAKWLKYIVQTRKARDIEYNIFSEVGMLPVVDHYYQPLINPKKHLKRSLRDDRNLPGIDFNDAEQLAILEKFNYNDELLQIPMDQDPAAAEISYYYNNWMYESGDGEYLYNVIRYFKPKKIIEIGSGQSTLMAINAINKNKEEDPNYQCEQTCIEPFEVPWLETKNVKVIRSKAEDVDIALFTQLEENDILFIDSSHIIRPQGDVLFEYLEVLPTLKPGVLVHIHDIFTPKDYPDSWLLDRHLLWNEQYLLEAFLTHNSQFKIIAAINYLFYHHRDALVAKCPVLGMQNADRGALWLRRV